MATRTIRVAFTGDARDLQNAARQSETSLSRWSARTSSAASAAAGAMKAAAAAFVMAMATTGIKSVLDSASDLNETVSKTKTVFGSAADGLLAWSKTANSSLGLSQRAALESAGTFGNLFKQLGLGASQAVGMSQSMVKLAGDFASFHNLDPTEVLEAMTAAFRGEYDPIQRVLPLMSAANVETKALSLTHKKSKDDLTALDKALAVHAMMMEGAGDAVGDFERTSNSAANQQRVLSATWENTKAAIGTYLLPAYTRLLVELGKLAAWIKDSGIPLATEWVAKIREFEVPAPVAASIATLKDILASIKDELSAFGAVLGGYAAAVAVVGTVVKVFSTLGLVVGGLAKGMVVLRLAAISASGAFALTPVGWVVIGLALIAAACVALYKRVSWFRKGWDSAWAASKKAIASFRQQAVPKLVEFGKATSDTWKSKIWPALKAIGGAFMWVWQKVVRPVIPVVIAYVKWWAANVMWAWKAVIWPALKAFGAYLSFLWTNFVKPTIAAIVTNVKVLATTWMWCWKNYLQPVIAWIGKAIMTMWTNYWGPAIRGAVGAVKGFVATATWWFKTISPIISGIGRLMAWLYKSVILPVFTSAKAIIVAWAAAFMWTYRSVIVPAVNGVVAAFKWLMNFLGGVFNYIRAGWAYVGTAIGWTYRNILIPIVNGVISAFKWLWTALSGVFNYIRSGWSFVGNVLSSVGAWIGRIVGGVVGAFMWLWSHGISPAINWIVGAFRWMHDVAADVFSRVRSAANWIGDGIRGTLGGIADFIRNAFWGALDAVKHGVNWMIDLVNEAINKLNDMISIANRLPGPTIPNIPHIPRLHAGGLAEAGGTYLVGENGPEILTMGDRSGRVMNGSQAGGQQINVHVTIGDQEVRDFMVQVYDEQNRLLARKLGMGMAR